MHWEAPSQGLLNPVELKLLGNFLFKKIFKIYLLQNQVQVTGLEINFFAQVPAGD